MKKVTTVARRKIALVIILIGMMLLILSPWSDPNPGPASAPTVAIPQGESVVTVQPVELAEPASLSVAVAMDEEAFKVLAEQNVQFRERHKDITVTLVRVDPETAYRYFHRASELEEAPDVMLMSSEWVSGFAASGYLLPVESAFVGKSLTEQFDALIAPVRWNDYTWGVPLDFDPYVLVWNETLLEQWLGGGVALPLTVEQWRGVAARSTQTYRSSDDAGNEAADPEASSAPEGPISWLSIDPNDPYALLSWLESASGTRSDTLWEDDGESWTGTPLGHALTLLSEQRTGVQFATSADQVRGQLYGGQTLVAAVPYSVAMEITDSGVSHPSVKLRLDHSAWKLPYIWPRGTSYVVSAGTTVEEAAMTWITEMSDAATQSMNESRLNRLPVYRSIYDSDTGRLSNLLPSRAGQAFPNQAPLAAGPTLPLRMEQLKTLWQRFASGQLTLDDWKLAWSKALADFKHNG